VTAKRAEAARVLAEIQRSDSQLEKAIEAYDLANVKLARIQKDLKVNGHDLVVARSNLKVGQKTLERRLVTLYASDTDNAGLEVILGAKSLDDMMSRLDATNRVSKQDARVLHEVVRFRSDVIRRQAELKRARSEQGQVVADRAAQKASIQSQLAQRQRMLSSIKGQIASLQAAELSRQLQMARSARARLGQVQLSHQAALDETAVGASASTPEGVSVAPPSTHGGVVGIAMQYLGVPYVWGGSTPSGFDCSGFTMYVYAQVGVSLPHNAAAQYGVGTPISKDQLEPGDLVFFDGLGHMGLYIGGGQFIHAPHTGDVVKISSLDESWYASTYVGARRI
jgi:cell wall-associated NlpC family hydrolase